MKNDTDQHKQIETNKLENINSIITKMKFSQVSISLLLYVILCIVYVLCQRAVSGSRSNKPSNHQNDLENVDIAEDYSDDTDEDESRTDRFSWKHHLDDHGIYSGRSLMSRESIRKYQDEEEEDSNDGRNASLYDGDPDPLKTIDYAEKEWQLMFRNLDIRAVSTLSSFFETMSKQSNVYEELISRLQPDCRRAIGHMGRSAKRHKLWALRMLDSNGKLPSGVVYGRFASPGDYEQCLSVRVDEHVYNNASDRDGEHHSFRGKYCLMDFRLPLPERPQDKLLSIHEPVLNLKETDIGKAYPSIANYSSYASVFYEIGYLHAICIPSVCDISDVTKSLSKSFESMFLNITNTVDCEERFDEPLPWRKSQIIALFILAVVFINAAVASLAYYITQTHSQPKKRNKQQQVNSNERDTKLQRERDFSDTDSTIGNFTRWLTDLAVENKFYSDCFSVQRNFERLTKPDPRGLTFVHYTRIVAMALTVITHTAGLGTLQAITKPADASNSEAIFRDFIPQMLANAFTSIQIFFFMAGFMLVISTYPSIKRDKGHISFLEYATKRAIRLLPGLTATICLNFLWPLVVNGPMLTYFIRKIVEPCEDAWWRTMAFLSNFDHVEKMCLRHSYFSASDYQLHILAFPLLVLLYKQPTVALVIAGLLTIAGFVAQVLMVLTKTVLPFISVDYIDKQAFFNVVHYIHHPSWNHMSAFFYGFIIGYFVVKQIRINLSETTIKRIWYIIMPMGFISIYAPYYWNHYKRPIEKWHMLAYVIIDRFVLLTTCAWLSYASMVLSRKPPTPPKPAATKTPDINLPDIVTLEKEFKKQGATTGIGVTNKSNTKASVIETDQQKLATPAGTMPRQRSSPDFQKIARQNESLPINRAASSIDISKTTGDQAATNKISEDQGKDDNKPATTDAQAKPARSQAPVSNVNTLCLVLSRLTFQLYLFNMVVLWVDVNHSKYLWFLSYYFIVSKAFCVYVYSSIMALIFFVLLESPSLTLYIAWVKSRAAKRAARKGPMDGRAKPNVEKGFRQANQTMGNSDIPNKERMIMTGIGDRGKNNNGSFDGLCMRSSTEENSQQRPTFSFIDLSSSVKDSRVGKTVSSDQTKM